MDTFGSELIIAFFRDDVERSSSGRVRNGQDHVAPNGGVGSGANAPDHVERSSSGRVSDHVPSGLDGQRTDSANQDPEELCPILLEPLGNYEESEIEGLPCGHRFHGPSLQLALARCGNRCPVCRFQLPSTIRDPHVVDPVHVRAERPIGDATRESLQILFERYLRNDVGGQVRTNNLVNRHPVLIPRRSQRVESPNATREPSEMVLPSAQSAGSTHAPERDVPRIFTYDNVDEVVPDGGNGEINVQRTISRIRCQYTQRCLSQECQRYNDTVKSYKQKKYAGYLSMLIIVLVITIGLIIVSAQKSEDEGGNARGKSFGIFVLIIFGVAGFFLHSAFSGRMHAREQRSISQQKTKVVRQIRFLQLCDECRHRNIVPANYSPASVALPSIDFHWHAL